MSEKNFQSRTKVDLIFDPESKTYQKKLRKSSDALLHALRASELYPDTHSIREGIMLGFSPEQCTSFMISSALMCAELGEPEFLTPESSRESHKKSYYRDTENLRNFEKERDRILNRWWVK
jgi:hypothetical protein